MKGKIEKIWINNLDDGRKYSVMLINGRKYNIWDSDYLMDIEQGNFQIGDELQFDTKKSGKYTNITIMEKTSKNTNHEFLENNHEFNNYSAPDRQKEIEIARMSSIKAALYITKDQLSLPMDERVDNTISIARKFEKYIVNDLPFPDDEPAE